MSTLGAAFSVQIEQGRSGFRVIARCARASATRRVEVTFSGGADGVWFRLTDDAGSRTFERDLIARQRPIAGILRLIGDEVELSRPPSEALLKLLFESLLLYVERLATPVPLPRWGRPLRDRQIERALELLERDLSKYWTVEHLARAVGLSRPVFARRFVSVLALSPMRYLLARRMQCAVELLLTSDASLSDVAARVGYRSPFAFGRAFKQHHGVAPGTFRRHGGAVCASAASLAA